MAAETETQSLIGQNQVLDSWNLLIAVYHVLKDGVVFQDLGPTHFERRNQEAIVRRSLHRLEALGYKVTVEAMPA